MNVPQFLLMLVSVMITGRMVQFQCLSVFEKLAVVNIGYILLGLVELLSFFGCKDEIKFEKHFDELCPSWLSFSPFFVTSELFRLSKMRLSITINYNTCRP
jgi:hypothetical protein